MSKTEIVLLGTEGDSTCAIYQALSAELTRPAVVLEEGVSRWQMIKRRARRLGVQTALGQAAFATTVVPILRRRNAQRIRDLRERLKIRPIDGDLLRVSSVNSVAARDLLRHLQPRVVVLSGTRIVENETLTSVAAPFLNMHAGLTPLYRGVHGGYWALAEGRPGLVGTTVHLVDTGIDTGAVIEQVTFDVSDRDSFVTYPLLHLIAGIPALIRAVRAALQGTLRTTRARTSESKLRYHPTLLTYLSHRLVNGVR